MAEVRRREMSADEFLLWCLTQEQRYELVDGIPVPLRSMSGASNAHDTITVNLIGSLFAQLQGTSCRPATADTALRTSIKRVRRPDTTIECSPPVAGSYEAHNPVAVFDVLSPSTRPNDRSVKLQEYMRHPTLRTIVHIDPEALHVLVYRRASEGQWEIERLEGTDAAVTVAEPHVVLPLASIYAGVPLPAAATNREPAP